MKKACPTCNAEMNGISSIASAGTAEDDYLWECPNGCDAASPGALAVILAAIVIAVFVLAKIFL